MMSPSLAGDKYQLVPSFSDQPPLKFRAISLLSPSLSLSLSLSFSPFLSKGRCDGHGPRRRRRRLALFNHPLIGSWKEGRKEEGKGLNEVVQLTEAEPH